MPIYAAAISAGGSLLGDIMSSNSAGATNALGAQEADLNRAFQSRNMQAQNAYNTHMLAEAQAYNTNMSNTAMQRRVADLGKAGLNPLLALGGPGPASSPMSSGATAGQPGGGSQYSPPFNPGASFQNLGQQAASAYMVDKQAKLLDAQADATKQAGRLDAANANIAEFKGSADWLMVERQILDKQYGVISAQATQAAQLVKTAVEDTRLRANQADQQQWLASYSKLSYETQQAIVTELRKFQNATFEAGTVAAQNREYVQSGAFGKFIATANAILEPVSSAAGVASKMVP